MHENQIAALADELRAVHALLENALNDLYAPLSDLARANLRATQPPVRALVVLATGVQEGTDENNAAEARARRILLAAALEMLAVALRIHGLLLGAGAARATANGTATAPGNRASADAQTLTHELDRSIAGSTILTGDYCFSRAAVLASQTNSATIVNIFSQALKNVSEGRLRSFFGGAITTHPERAPDGLYTDHTGYTDHTDYEALELARAGVRGAAHLAALAPAQEECARLLAEALAAGHALPATAIANTALTTQQRTRWQAAWRIVAEETHKAAGA